MRLSARLIRPTILAVGPVTVRLTNAASLTSRSSAAPSLRNTKRHQDPFAQADKGRLPFTIPYQIFKSAAEEGAISISARKAGAIARDCVSVAINNDFPRSVKISERVKEDPSLIARIAVVLSRSPRHQRVANWIVLSLAFEGEPIATTMMAVPDILNGKKANKQFLENLRSIAEEAKVPQAMVLQGKSLEREGKYTQAAELYEKAMAASKPISDGTLDQFLKFKVPQPWEAYRSIKEKLGEHDEAKRALTIGVEEYGTLSAYRQTLPDLLNSKDFAKYETFLTKCAMTGDEISCHELGNLYLTAYLTREASEKSNSETSADAQGMEFASKYSTPELREIAVEWYKIATIAGSGQSALVLAGLFRQENQLDIGMEYLNLASQDSQCEKASDLLRDQWHNTETKVDIKKDLMS